MSYNYKRERCKLFSDEGLRALVDVKDFVDKALAFAGAVRMGEIIHTVSTESNWMTMACVDRLVETEQIREITVASFGNSRVFVRKGK